MSFGSGLLSAPQSLARIEALTARDDNGVEWSIDPENGDWRYTTREGGFAYAEPPSWGLATLTPHDLGSGSKDPDARITLYEVDQTLQSGLTGATRRSLPTVQGNSRAFPTKYIFASSIIAVAVLMTVVIGIVR